MFFALSGYLSVTSTSPAFTDAPFTAVILSTVPAPDAMISFSIFMASRMTRTSPLFTGWPSVTLISRTVPGIGAVTVLAPAAAGAAGAGAAGAGAGAAGAAATGVGAGAAGAADATVPASVTSTAYVTPLTVMLYFFISISSFHKIYAYLSVCLRSTPGFAVFCQYFLPLMLSFRATFIHGAISPESLAIFLTVRFPGTQLFLLLMSSS